MKIVFACFFSLVIFSCAPENENEKLTDDERIYSNRNFSTVAAQPMIVYDKLHFGNGYNSTTGQEHFGIIEYENVATNTEVVGGAMGNSGSVSMEILEDKESLKKSLNVNAKVDLNLKLYGVTSNNTAKVDLYKETSFDSFSQNALLKAEYINEPLVILNATVKEQWIELAKKNPDEFLRTCGDMFVSKIYTGGSVYTLFSMQSRDQHQKEQNEYFFESMNSYLGNQFNVQAKTTALEESSSSVKNTNTIVVTEGGGNTPESAELVDFIKYANEFKTQVTTDSRPVVLFVELSPFESIAGFPKTVDFNKIRVGQKEFLESATDYYDDIDHSLETAEFVKENTAYFDPVDLEEADSVLVTYTQLISEARLLINRCRSDFNDCDMALVANAVEDFIVYDPDIDFPSFIGDEKALPIEPSTEFVDLFPTTGDGTEEMMISIDGRVEARIGSNSQPKCLDVSYHEDRNNSVYKAMKINKSWWRTDYVDAVELYYRPYYQFRYVDPDNNNNVLRTFRWNGTPFKAEPNVKVQVRLLNPASKLQWRYDYGNQSYTNRYADLGKKLEQQLGYTRKPKYSSLRGCDGGEAPIATIFNKNAERKQPVTLGNSDEDPLQPSAPTPTIENGYLTYEYE